MRGWPAPLAVAALLAAAAVPAGATSPATARHVVRPFVGDRLSPGLRVVRAARGYCWTGSGADAGRSDAWRCFIGNFIHDPCFSPASASVAAFVVCPVAPWSSRVVKLVLTRRLPLAARNTAARPTPRAPWGIQLASGKRCTALTGATRAIGGRGISYACAGGGVLAGLPRRAAARWTISYAAGFQARRTTRVAIAAAWW